MKALFDIAGNTIVGYNHLGEKVLLGTNNHDAHQVLQTATHSLGIVCDGCGSGEHSEVGAKIGALLLKARLNEYVSRLCHRKFEEVLPDLEIYLERARQDVLAYIRTQVLSFGGSMSDFVKNYYLFTVMGFIICADWTAIFSIGDGVFMLNEETVVTNSGEANEPVYLSYEITGSTLSNQDPENLRFKIRRLIKTEKVKRLLIASDGAAFFGKIQERSIPGQQRLVGGLEQFFEQRYFDNPDAVRRTLALINTKKVRMNSARDGLTVEHGLLPDDTTIVVAKSKL